MADATVKQKLIQKLKGSFDLTFLFGKGIAPFEKSTKRDGLLSLLIPALLIPPNLLEVALYKPQGLEHQPLSLVLTIVCSTSVVWTVVGVLFLWGLAVVLDRRDRFWTAFAASNWTSIPLFLIALPFFYLAIHGVYSREQMDRIFSVISYYGMVFVDGCVVFRGLKIDWMLAGAFAMLNAGIGQEIWNFFFWVHGVPLVW